MEGEQASIVPGSSRPAVTGAQEPHGTQPPPPHSIMLWGIMVEHAIISWESLTLAVGKRCSEQHWQGASSSGTGGHHLQGSSTCDSGQAEVTEHQVCWISHTRGKRLKEKILGLPLPIHLSIQRHRDAGEMKAGTKKGDAESVHQDDKMGHSLIPPFFEVVQIVLCQPTYQTESLLEENKHLLALPVAQWVQHSAWHTGGPQSVLAGSSQQEHSLHCALRFFTQ